MAKKFPAFNATRMYVTSLQVLLPKLVCRMRAASPDVTVAAKPGIDQLVRARLIWLSIPWRGRHLLAALRLIAKKKKKLTTDLQIRRHQGIRFREIVLRHM
jgi:hypothetical protein